MWLLTSPIPALLLHVGINAGDGAMLRTATPMGILQSQAGKPLAQ